MKCFKGTKKKKKKKGPLSPRIHLTHSCYHVDSNYFLFINYKQ